MSSKRIFLHEWRWQDASDEKLCGRTVIPTSIHQDLLFAGQIPDPYLGRNEAHVQWIHDKTWTYSTTFASPARTLEQQQFCVMVFEGLDTFGTVRLNGREILKCENMFITHRVHVAHLLEPENELSITFESAYHKGESLRAKKGHRLCWNGHYGRVYVRKAQYHFGWDWGPSLVTCGPWKPIYLEVYTTRIDSIDAQSSISSDFSAATINVDVILDDDESNWSVNIQLLDPEGNLVHEHESHNKSVTFKVVSPRLWYPHNLGEQPLYQVKVTAKSESGDVLDGKTQTLGLRTIELVQSPLEEGSTFYFKCNEVPIFIGGSNWIPGDSFLPRMSPERYRSWIDLAIRGNQNMIRVWGGGIYENDAFYDECDRQGVLVWQDFCFACGQYPSDDDFVKSVREEASHAICRLRSHPSLAIWAGNNEDYQIANEGLGHDMSMPEDQWKSSSFGARHIYERVLPDLLKELSPDAIYWPGSPFGGVDNNSDRTIGDVHIWNVSSGMLLPYQRYPDITGRFVSEFGMMSCPALETVEAAFFEDGEDKHPQSESFEFHCKASSYEKRMFTCMAENLKVSLDLPQFIYLTQLIQSEAMGYAYRGWRRRFEGRECGGALVWQLNDSWPTTSWAIIDYYQRPKPAYFAIARAMRPLTTGITRKIKVNLRPNLQHEAFCNGRTKADAAAIIAHATPHIYPIRESRYSVWVANASITERRVSVSIRFISIKTGLEVWPSIERTVDAKATGTTEIIEDDTPESEPTVVVSDLYDEDGGLLAHEMDWPQPLKHLSFPDRKIDITVKSGGKVTISAAKPVKGLFFTNANAGWSDNCLDISPGQETVVTVAGLEGEPRWIYYGMNN